MAKVTERDRGALESLAQRHGVGVGAVEVLAEALVASGGRQAQFNHPDLGGMGQWSSGGMTMIGDMFNADLKARVAALCRDVAGLVRDGGIEPAADAEPHAEASASRPRWPAELGRPSSTGSQNGARYAVFPDSRRLAIEQDGEMTIYDTGDRRISGASQQQGDSRSLTFSGQDGRVRLEDLQRVDGRTD